MRLLVVYLDTSVPSAYFDDRSRSRMLETQEFWNRLSSYEVLISDLVIREVRQLPDESRREALEHLLRQFTVAVVDDEVRELARRYLEVGVFGASSSVDALHVAAAQLSEQTSSQAGISSIWSNLGLSRE